MLAAVVDSLVRARSRAGEGDDRAPDLHADGLTARTGWLVAGCAMAVCVPLVVAVAGFRRPTWTPVLDLAMTELRVRDVGGSDTPLIGLPGRIGTLDQQGSHPGPLSFYALAPTYRLLGSTAWALQVGALLVHAVAIVTALVIAARRAGPPLVIGVAVLLASLTAGYGGGALTEPWNPYLPLLWWVVVLLAVWSVLCGDLAMLPVAVLAGSFCAQTHVPYLGLSLGMGALATGAIALGWWRHPDERSRMLRWVAASLALGSLLWLPPTIDQIRNEPGNYRTLVDHFADPEEEAEGLRDGVVAGLRYLDVADLLSRDVVDPGSLVTNEAGRRRHHGLVALHWVVAAGLALMAFAISRIFGVVWYYLTLWGWAVGLLALLATVWTGAVIVSDRWEQGGRREAGRIATVGMAVVGGLLIGRFTIDAPTSPHADATVASQLAAVMDDTAAGLAADDGVATGREGRYLVTWSDALHIGSQGYGLLSELERRGFDVAVEAGRRVPATPQRTLADPTIATARVHLATGAFVDSWRGVPGAVELASVDPRSPADRREQDQLRVDVIAGLRALGLDDLVSKVDDNLFGAAIDERVPETLRRQMGRMLEIGAPLSVFVAPSDTADP